MVELCVRRSVYKWNEDGKHVLLLKSWAVEMMIVSNSSSTHSTRRRIQYCTPNATTR